MMIWQGRIRCRLDDARRSNDGGWFRRLAAMLRPGPIGQAIAFVPAQAGGAAAMLTTFFAAAVILPPLEALASTAAMPSTSLRLDGPITPGLSGLVVATRAGLFERAGFLVELIPGGPDADAIGSVARGTAMIGLARADNFLVARSKGIPIVSFAAGYLESPAVFFVAKNSGIRTVRDFAGKRVGYRRGSQAAVVYEALMAKLEIPRNRIQEVAVGSDPAPLIGGKVDVWPGSIEEAAVLRQQNFEYAVIAPINFGIHVPGTVYFATEKTLRDNPALIRGFVRALIAGWELAYADPEKSIPLIVSHDPFSLTPDRVRADLDLQREFMRPLAMRFAEFNQTQWRALREILLRHKLMIESVDLSTAVTYEFLREAYRKPTNFAK
jgi:ABC-type nitrate/sulfonate/bicarbonate transport system substrate-binding protein